MNFGSYLKKCNRVGGEGSSPGWEHYRMVCFCVILTVHVPISTQVYKWALMNLIIGGGRAQVAISL